MTDVMTDFGITRISLKRGACFGDCPVYEVFINNFGEFYYKGEYAVERIGSYTGKIPKLEFQKLCAFIQDSGYLQVEDSYSSDWTDDATVTTSIVINGREKSVRNYGNAAPDCVRILEEFIDKSLLQAQWYKTKNDLRKPRTLR